MSRIKTPTPKVENAAVIYHRLFQYVKPHWLSLVVAIAASMIFSGIDAWFVHFLEPLLNHGLVEKNRHFLAWAPLWVLLAFGMRGLASFFSTYNIASVSRNVIMQLRKDMFAHLQRLPAHFYDHTSSGQTLSLILYGVEQVANASADVLTTAVQASFLIMGLLVVMFSISWKLSMLYFIIIPCIAVVMRYASKRVRRLSLSIQESMADITQCTEENLEAYRVVRTFGGQVYEQEKFANAIKQNRAREMKVVASRSWSVSGVQLIAATALSITLYIATFDIATNILTPGGFVSMVAAMLALLKPLKDLTSMQNKLYRGLAGAQSVFELLDQPAEVDAGAHSIDRVKGRIVFQAVGFSYTQAKPVLHAIDLIIEPGEVCALVGHSGSGKSSLVSLLSRFYDHYTGTISLDGVSLRDYRLENLRAQIAIVSQQVVLFNDTLANNIAYGQTNIPEFAILAAAEAAYLGDFIAELPAGLRTRVGENGVLLSGGQRQRIAIARALLKNAPILILDEATSALDTESERCIQAALETLKQHRTTVVIAHRLSTVEHADKIVVMEHGKIIEQGKHATLLAEEGAYARLYRMQFSDELVL